MRAAFVILSFLIFINILSAQQEYTEETETPLVEILEKIEEKNDVLFSYSDDAIRGHTISYDAQIFTLSKILDKVFGQTPFTYEILDNRHILVVNDHRERGSLCGYIKEKDTEEPIPYATVYNIATEIGVESDEQGYFELSTKAATDPIEVSYLGYETIRLNPSTAEEGDCHIYYLQMKENLLGVIELTEYLADGINQTVDAHMIVLEPQRMNLLPGSIDRDILAGIQFLPGINSPSESLEDISIRGGTADQNLILWDNIPVYHTSHLFGTISAFNPHIIDRVDVYRNGVASKYGGRVSGVIDIKSHLDMPKKFSVGAGLSLTQAHLDVESPLWKNSALMISARRSITDALTTPTFVSYAEKVFQGSRIDVSQFNDPSLKFGDKFIFNDANLKWVYRLGKNEFSISTLGGLNRLDYSTDIPRYDAFSFYEFNLNYGGGNLAWNRSWSPTFSSEVYIANAEYRKDDLLTVRFRDTPEDTPISGRSTNDISDGSFNLKFEWMPKSTQTFRFGYQYTENEINLEFSRREFALIEKNSDIFHNKLHSLYGEYALSLPQGLHLDMGLRYQSQPIIGNDYFEPRISVITNLTDHIKLKASTSKHFQFISQLVIFDQNKIGINNKIWVASNNTTIPVIEANQWVGGLIYQNGSWTIDVEGYVKELAGITSLSSGLGTIPNHPYSQGNSRIRGIDILLKKRYRNYRSWLSYTLSEINYEFPNITEEAFPASHDQSHVLKWVHLINRGKWKYSLGMQLKSGLPFTETEGIVYKENAQGTQVPRIEFAEVNQSRLDTYFRLDASVTYNFGNIEGFNGYLALSLQNLTGAENLLGKQYVLSNPNQANEPKIITTDVLGLGFTPNLAVNIRW